MSDFVAEIRPRSHCIPKFVPTQVNGDFVAEIRPRNNNSSQLGQLDRQCQAMDCSDQDLESILSNRHFSRERITRLLEGSIVTLVEKLLTGRPITRVEGSLSISLARDESPITVNLNRTFSPLAHGTDQSLTQHSLESRMNVKVKHGDFLSTRSSLPLIPEEVPTGQTPSPVLQSPFYDKSFAVDAPWYDCKRETFYNMSDNEDRSCFPLESTRDGERCSPSPSADLPCKSASPVKDLGNTTISQAGDSSLETHLKESSRHESDYESGYTSNEKEDCDSNSELTDHSNEHKHCSTYNDYYCSGFDGKSTVYSSKKGNASMSSPNETTSLSPGSSRDGGDEMDDDDDQYMDFETPLVIDERPITNTEGSSTEQICRMDVHICKDDGHSHDHERCSVMKMPCRRMKQDATFHNERMRECLADEAEDLDYPVSSDITDTDVPVDLSGDSSHALEAGFAVPHPQSLVTKHPDGFRCKQCSKVMGDAEAVSRHAQSDHELYCCTFCYRTFTAKNNLKRHIRIHTGHRPYQCTQCSQSFARRDDLKGHMLRHGYSKPFRCSLCKKGYTDRACVKNHMAKEHRSRLMHVCPQCGESYDQEEAFTAHKKTHPELQQFSCITCSFIGNNNLMTLKHSLLHSHKLFSCKPCNAYFADPFDYTNHVRKHKKIVSFSQYVCCFCDVALSTYDQYVRHEYSHAQGKIHMCKTCKKQFKNKCLLQEHMLSHEKPQLDKTYSEQICTQSTEIDKPIPVFLQPKEVKDVISKPGLESRFTDDYSNFYCDPHVLQPCPTINAEEERNRSEAQLLDLRVKKTPEPTFSADNFKNNQYSFSSCSGVTGFTERNFPRNGVVLSENCYLDQEVEATEALKTRKLVYEERSCETVLTQADNTSKVSNVYARHYFHNRGLPDGSLNVVNADQMCYDHTKTVGPIRTKSTERLQVISNTPFARFERRPVQRTVSQDCIHRTPLRFSPYTREKLADLTAKFIAARGTKLFEERTPLKAVLASCENRNQLPLCREFSEPKREVSSPLAMRQQTELKEGSVFKQNPLFFNSPSGNQNSNVAGRISQDTDNVTREDSNPEMALMYHAPTVVKSEVLLDQDLDFEASENCQFQNTFTGHGNSSTADDSLNGRINYQGSAHICEDCKKEFRSFPELEHHSVEMHKRYLCEHCGKSFTARPNRDRHVRYHTGERPYKCDLCEQAFFRGDDLKYHRTTRHPTAQPYTCTHCMASFAWGRDLDRHIRHSKCKC